MIRLILVAVFTFLLSASNIKAQDFCQGDFNYDGSVDAGDISTFLEDFGRNSLNNPCPADGPAPVIRTGQTINYSAGDDGYYEKGVAWPIPRFTDNGAETNPSQENFSQSSEACAKCGNQQRIFLAQQKPTAHHPG